MADVALRATISGFSEATAAATKLKEAHQELGKAQAEADRRWAQSSINVKSVNDSLVEVGSVGSRIATAGFAAVAVAVAAAAYSFANAAKEVLTLGSALQDLHETTGIGVERLSEIKVLSEINGVAFNAVAKGIGHFNNNIGKMGEGTGRAAMALQTMGIEAREFDGVLKSQDKLLMEVADKFTTYEGGINKTALANALFGGSADEMVKAMQGGSRGLEEAGVIARQTGRIMTDETAKGAADFTKEVRILMMHSGELARSLAGPLVAALGEVAAQMKIARQEGEGFWGTMLEGMKMAASTAVFGTTLSNLKDINAQIAKTTEMLQQAESRPGSGRSVDVLTAKLSKLYGEQGRLQGLLEFDKPNKPETTAAPDLEKPDKKGRAERHKDETDQILRQEEELIRNQIALGKSSSQNLIDFYEMYAEFFKDDVNKSTALLAKAAKERENIYKKEMQEEEHLRRALEGGEREAEREQREADRLALEFARKAMEAIEDQKLGVDALKAAYAALAAELMGYGGASERAAEVVIAKNKKILSQTEIDQKRVQDILGETEYNTIGVFGGIYNASRDTYAGILKGNITLSQGIKSVWKGIANSILDEFARIQTSAVFRMLLGDKAGGKEGGGSGGLLGLAVTAVKAYIGASGGGGAGAAGDYSGGSYSFAGGGDTYGSGEMGFATGGSFMVGGGGGTDSQQVRFKASPGERVTVETPDQQRRSGGGVSVQQTINFSANTPAAVRDAVYAMMPQIQEAAVSAVENRRSRGRG